MSKVFKCPECGLGNPCYDPYVTCSIKIALLEYENTIASDKRITDTEHERLHKCWTFTSLNQTHAPESDNPYYRADNTIDKPKPYASKLTMAADGKTILRCIWTRQSSHDKAKYFYFDSKYYDPNNKGLQAVEVYVEPSMKLSYVADLVKKAPITFNVGGSINLRDLNQIVYVPGE